MPLIRYRTPDLVHKTWREEEFRQTAFSIKGRNPSHLEIAITGTQRRHKKPLRTIQANQEIGDLIQITKGLDTLAQEYLQRSSEKPGKSAKVPEKALASLTQQIRELRTLRSNLEVHDQLIAKYNTDRSHVKCPDHHLVIRQIDAEVLACEKTKHDLENTEQAKQSTRGVIKQKAAHNFNIWLTSLEQRAQQGANVSFAYLVHSCDQDVAKIKTRDLFSEKEQQHYLERLYQALNQCTLNTAIDKLSSGDSPLLDAVQEGARLLGLSPKDQSRLFKSLEKELCAELKKAFPIQTMDIPSLKFVEKVQQWLINRLIADPRSGIKIPAKQQTVYLERLGKLCRNVIRFEKRLCTDLQKLWPELQSLIVQRVGQDYGSDFSPQQIGQFIGSIPMPSGILAPLIHDHLGQQIRTLQPLKGPLWLLSKEEYQRLGAYLGETRVAAIKQKLGECAFAEAWNFVDGQCQMIRWERSYAPYRCFSFSQYKFDSGNTLGQGVCLALDYIWSQQIQKQPTVNLTNAFDLLPKTRGAQRSPVPMPESPIPAYVRYIQATYEIEPANLGLKLPKKILEKDGIEQRMLIGIQEPPTQGIKELVELLLAKNKSGQISLQDSSGIVTVGAAGKRAHVFGLQILEKEGIYRFWDVNEGLWQFNSLPGMMIAFTSYLAIKYHQDTYQRFSAAQYVPKVRA